MNLVVVSAAFGAVPSFPTRVSVTVSAGGSAVSRTRPKGRKDGAFRMSLNNGLTELSCLSDVHTEAVQAALAKHKERKMAVPMPSKRRSLVVQTSMDAYTPPGERPPSASRRDAWASQCSPRSAGPRLCSCGTEGALTPTP